MKIVYCVNSIQAMGGISTAIITKANVFIEKGLEVFIAVSDHNFEIPVDLSDKVIVKDLNVKYYEDDWKSKFNVLKGIFFKRRKHKRNLAKTLYEINPDIVISVGQCEKYFLPGIKGKWKTIREFHYDKNYRLRASNSLLQKLMALFINIYDYKFKIKKYDRIVVLTNEDKKNNWDNNSKIKVIPNMVPMKNTHLVNLENKKIIAIGRLVSQKNFSSLIRAFSSVSNIHPTWRLDIYGEGELRDQLEKEIKINNLWGKVFLMGKHPNIIDIMKEYSFLVLSSLYEGMPIVLLEAMVSGLPIISYDCPHGPKEIIVDQKTGFLVPLNNEYILSQKINELIENPEKRNLFSKNSLLYAEKFSTDRVYEKWLVLFEQLIN